MHRRIRFDAAFSVPVHALTAGNTDFSLLR